MMVYFHGKLHLISLREIQNAYASLRIVITLLGLLLLSQTGIVFAASVQNDQGPNALSQNVTPNQNNAETAENSGGKPAQPTSKTAAGKKIKQFNIRGYRIGMSQKEVKKILAKRGVRGYESAYSDLYVYDAEQGEEISLSFACSPKGPILNRVDLITGFSAEDSAVAIRNYRKKLRSKYGPPTVTSRNSQLDYCWGQCRKKAVGTKLSAKITAEEGGKRKLIVVLENTALVHACIKEQRVKTATWLNQWISDVQKFRPGLAQKSIRELYVKRYGATPVMEAVPDDTDKKVLSSEINENDYLTALGSSSRLFEGDAPGKIILKSTGNQAGRKRKLNDRLFYSFFSTTAFKTRPLAGKLNEKLNLFSRNFGNPDKIDASAAGLVAEWTKGAIKRKLEIFESGFITLEQYNPSIKESYRKASVKEISSYNKNRYSKQVF